MKVLKFYADWCGPCKSLSATLEKHYTGEVPVESVNIDTNQEAAITYGIRGVPTCILIDEHGTEVRRKSGVMMIDEFEKFVKG
jgi:thioredoxin 1